ncbi:hypothetical protein Hanom_Chr04g00360071 [Helianthus anomalus]
MLGYLSKDKVLKQHVTKITVGIVTRRPLVLKLRKTEGRQEEYAGHIVLARTYDKGSILTQLQ